MTQLENTPSGPLEFRCPQCEKLYSWASPRFLSSSVFECKACFAKFRLETAKEDASIVPRPLALPKVQNLHKLQKLRTGQDQASAKNNLERMRECPKCQAMNPLSSEDCYKCQVVISKAHGLSPQIRSLGGRPSLMKAWSNLFNDYDNLQKHFEFVDQCEELQALPFALKKYQDLKEAQPHDKTAVTMLQKTLLRSHKALRPVQQVFEASISRRFLRFLPILMALFLICLGFLRPGSRNLIGFGAVVLFLFFGVQYLVKGRLRFEDLWKV